MPLQYDPETAMAHVAAADPVVARIIQAVGPLEIPARPGAFKSLARAIFFQQLAGPAARAIMTRVLAVMKTDEEKWYPPKRFLKASDDELRVAGLSRQKIAYLRDLADKFATGFLTEDDFHHLDDDAVIERVSQVK